jgi:hypothetical protein
MRFVQLKGNFMQQSPSVKLIAVQLFKNSQTLMENEDVLPCSHSTNPCLTFHNMIVF